MQKVLLGVIVQNTLHAMRSWLTIARRPADCFARQLYGPAPPSFVSDLDDHAVHTLPHGRVRLRSFVDPIEHHGLGDDVVSVGELHGVLRGKTFRRHTSHT